MTERMLSLLKTYENIYIYGAGCIGKRVCKMLTEENVAIAGFLVTSFSGEVKVCEGHKIRTAYEVEPQKNSLAVIAVGEKYRAEIENYLETLGWQYVYYLDEVPEVDLIKSVLQQKSDADKALQGLSTGIINWYPFRENSSVLEVKSDSSRDLTAVLSQRCAVVDCLCSNSLLDFEAGTAEKVYDYVIAVNVFENTDVDRDILIARMKRFLKSDGRLLIVCRNRYGLKYFCGATDEFVNNPYEGIQGKSVLLGRLQIEQILNKAGFSHQRFYYLMPDEGAPQVVLTDDWKPKDSIRDRMFAYEPYVNTRAVSENSLYDGIIEGGLLPWLADCYLIESCSMPMEEAHVIYSALSTDREEDGFATTLFSDRTVCKRALRREGMAALQRQCEAAEVLAKRGLLTIPMRIDETGQMASMSLVENSPSLVYFRKLVKEKNEKSIIELLNQFQKDILQSSDWGMPKEEEALNVWGVHAAKLGPVLEKGYIDMIPYNAFYAEGKLCYYDQEFIIPQCPVSYIMFRVIRYTYSHIPEMEKVLPMAAAMQKYDLTELWDSFLKLDDRMVEQNRRISQHKELWKWRVREENTISNRARLPKSGDQQNTEDKTENDSKKYHIGLLMGVFDLYHQGHLNLIRRAKEQCEYLRVGVLSDELVWKLKKIHPTIPTDQRMDILGSVRYVDEVVLIDNMPSRIEEWHRRPFDCFFSGDDYRGNEYWEWEKKELNKLGADIVFFPYSMENSSSRIRKKLQDK